jgi:hypothetical protein
MNEQPGTQYENAVIVLGALKRRQLGMWMTRSIWHGMGEPSRLAGM